MLWIESADAMFLQFCRVFEVNGNPVFIRGGNYILSDGLLRLSEERYKTEVQFHADMNMNMIRIWAGALAERPAFYDACDERGLLVRNLSLLVKREMNLDA